MVLNRNPVTVIYSPTLFKVGKKGQIVSIDSRTCSVDAGKYKPYFDITNT